jgi:hypothetical protein
MTQQQKGRIRLDASLFSCAPQRRCARRTAPEIIGSFSSKCLAINKFRKYNIGILPVM